jgi:uncharacterized protein YqeY
MELQTRLQEDMKTALKAGQKDRLSVIRMLLSDVKNVDLMPGKPTPEQVIEAYGKKLKKSIEEYERLGRPIEAEKLRGELAVVEGYLPQRASTEDTAKLVDEFLAAASFTEKHFGQAMGQFMKKYGQQVEAGLANKLLKEKLAGK